MSLWGIATIKAVKDCPITLLQIAFWGGLGGHISTILVTTVVHPGILAGTGPPIFGIGFVQALENGILNVAPLGIEGFAVDNENHGVPLGQLFAEFRIRKPHQPVGFSHAPFRSVASTGAFANFLGNNETYQRQRCYMNSSKLLGISCGC